MLSQKLTEAQLSLCRDIRRRGKNKVFQSLYSPPCHHYHHYRLFLSNPFLDMMNVVRYSFVTIQSRFLLLCENSLISCGKLIFMCNSAHFGNSLPMLPNSFFFGIRIYFDLHSQPNSLFATCVSKKHNKTTNYVWIISKIIILMIHFKIAAHNCRSRRLSQLEELRHRLEEARLQYC